VPKAFPKFAAQVGTHFLCSPRLLCATARGEPDRTLHHREPRGREESSDNGHVIASSYCSGCSDHRVNPGAGELAEIGDLHPIVVNERPKNVGILG
jgi:hypothetical protein